MPRCPLQPHSLQSKVGGIKFVLGRWVPQRLSCYKHFYCLVYQHTPLAPCPWLATLLESVIHIVCNYYYTLMGHEPIVRPQRTFTRSLGVRTDICCEHLIGAIVMNAIVMCSRTREIADNVGLKRFHWGLPPKDKLIEEGSSTTHDKLLFIMPSTHTHTHTQVAHTHIKTEKRWKREIGIYKFIT